jgi:hypothetical protein
MRSLRHRDELPIGPRFLASVKSEQGRGQPLPDSVRADLGPRLGTDLSVVRVHTGEHADRLARSVRAEAFTSGGEVFFRRGRYDPVGAAGRRLLAHELVHVAQQAAGVARPAGGITQPEDDVEIAASRSTIAATPGPAQTVELTAGVSVFRAAATAAGPGGPDRCFNLLQDIIFWLGEVARRIEEAKLDMHNLFNLHHDLRNPGPDGSWMGHRQKFEEDRQKLRRAIAEWDKDDDCRNRELSSEQQSDLDEARLFADAEFPERPARASQIIPLPDPGLRQRVIDLLLRVGVPVAVVGTIAVLVIAAIVDPEPFSKVALIIGVTAAVAFFALLGGGPAPGERGGGAPPDLQV